MSEVDATDLLRRFVAHCEAHDSDADLASSTVHFSPEEIVIIDAMRAEAKADKAAA